MIRSYSPDLQTFYCNLINNRTVDEKDFEKIAYTNFRNASPLEKYNRVANSIFHKRLKPFFLLLIAHQNKDSIVNTLPKEIIYVIAQFIDIKKPPAFSDAFEGKLDVTMHDPLETGDDYKVVFYAFKEERFNAIHRLMENYKTNKIETKRDILRCFEQIRRRLKRKALKL